METMRGPPADIEPEVLSAVDACRLVWETRDAWALRRRFLAKHWSDFDHDRDSLLARSQIFVNMIFMQCKYDE